MTRHPEKIEQRTVDKLIPYARNSRTHSDAQVAQIAASIKEWGWTTPLLVDETGGIIAGHGRLLAARKLGMTEVPVIVAAGWTDAQKRAYVIADNKLALNAGWDESLLALEFGELEGLGFDVELTGFSAEEIAALTPEEVPAALTDEDEVQEPPEEPVTRLGDVWLLGRHRLMCGDSTSVDAVEKLMDGGKADMVFTDPPYGMHLDADYKTAKGPGIYKGKDMSRSSGVTHRNIVGDHDDFTPDLINTVFSNFDYCAEIFLWGADYYAELITDRKEGSWVVWDKVTKTNGEQSGVEAFHGSNFELCWSRAKHKRELARIMHKGLTSVENDKRVHPTQKPVALAQWFFDRWGSAGDVVADLFGGSGSTLIACEKTGRIARLMELDPKYCDVIIKRWQDYTGKQATHAETGQPFAEASNGNKEAYT